MKTRLIAALLGFSLFATTPPLAHAADFYWDPDADDSGNLVDGANLGGSGTWDTAAANWWDLTNLVAWPNLNTDRAFFSYAYSPGVPTYNAVTVDAGGVTANALHFLRSGYTLTGGGITLAGTDPTLYAALGTTTTIESLLVGSDGIVKTGGGAIRLANAGNTYTGVTTIANGSLIITDPGALGADSSAVVVTEINPTPGNTATLGFPGGMLVLDGSGGGFDFSRDLSLQGGGPINSRSSAVLSIGNNELSGTVTMAAGALTPTTFRSTRMGSLNGTLTLSGTLNVQGTAGTTISTLGAVNTTGVGGSYALTGVLQGAGTLEKSGVGTLFLNPSDTSGFSGRLRVSGSATSGQSSVRITSITDSFGNSVFGTANGTTNSAPIDMNGGVLEIRSDDSSNVGKNWYSRANSTLFLGPAVGGTGISGTANFGAFRSERVTTTFNSRNGYGASFGAWTQQTSNGNTTITNNMGGMLTFTGNAWNNSDGSNRTLTIGGNGNTLIAGSINTSGAGVKTLTKTGSGSLTIDGNATTLNGPVNINGGAIIIRDFRSLNNDNTATIGIGNGGTAGALIIGTDSAPTAAGLTTEKTIDLKSTTGAPSIYANQPGSDPVVLNGAFTTSGGSATQNKTLTLGGTNTADNIIPGSIANQAGATTGKVSLLKVGEGTWVLAGENTYTGATTIANGTLKLLANAEPSTVLPSTNAIIFGNSNVYSGSTLEFVGHDGENNEQALGNLTTSSGANTVKVTPGVGGTASLSFTGQSTGAAGSVNYVGADFVNNQIIVTGGNGFVGRTNYWEGADFAYRESNVLRAPVYGADSGFVNSDAALTAGSHNEIAGSFSAGTMSVNTLKIAGSHTLTLDSGATLTLSNGGLLVTGGSATVTGGTSLALGSQALVARVNLDTDTLAIDTVVTGTGGLTKNGVGILILSGANAQTGTVTINEGTVQLSGSGRLGAAAALTIRQAGVLDLNGVTPSTNTNAFNNNGVVTNTSGDAVTFTIGGSNGTGTSYGIIDETNGVIHVTKLGNGAQNWFGQSTYTGVTTIGGTGLVTVDFLADGGIASGIGASSPDAANLVFTGSTGGLSYRGNIVIGNLSLGSTSATTDRLFTLTGSGVTIASSPSTNINNAIIWSNADAIVHGGTDQDRTFTFSGTSQGDNTFNPQITDATGFATSVVKTGTGIWRLGNANNTYTGSTTITQGVLMAVDGASLPAASNLIFNGGALYSQGTLNRDIGAGPGEMQFAAPAANTAQFSGGFQGGDSKLTVTWSGNPVWGSTTGFLDNRNGLILNGSQARAQGATGSIALSEVEIAADFSLGAASGTGKSLTVSTSNGSATVNITTGDTSGLVVGQSIYGTNIPLGAYITSVNTSTQVTVSANASATGTGISATVAATTLRPIRVDDNGNTGADFATISGAISAAEAVTGIRKLGAGNLRLFGDNTYTGETNVNQGVLSVLTLGDSSNPGQATSVGLSTNANLDAHAITIGNTGTGGAILQYLGAGETSDRKIRLNSTTGGNQIHADGSGPLILTNVANDMVAGAKILYLRGTNTEGNLIASQLSDNGGALSVQVDGSAVWVLTNALNDYSGNTTNSAGGLGIGHDSVLGSSTLALANGNLFAYGADRSIANTTNQNNNTSQGFIGDYSLTFSSGYNLLASSNNVTLNNNILGEDKSLTFQGVTANNLTANRTWTIDGSGTTFIDGDIATATAFGLNITKNGDGTLILGGAGSSNFNNNNANIDLDRGTLRMAADNAIPSGAGAGGLIISPELSTSDVATFDLSGTSQTVNAFTATTDGTVIVDNTSATAAVFRFGANDSIVNFGSGLGSYSIQNTGTGALDIVKLGNTTATFISGLTLAHAGVTASEGGGIYNIASPVTATTGLRVIDSSTLALTGGIANPGLITSIEVGGGATLSLLDGAGSLISNLDILNLGATDTGTVTLNLNIGDGATDTFTLTSGGVLNLGNTITFNLTDAGLSASTTYTLLNLIDGGIDTFDRGNMIQGATPGGFDSMTWFVDDNVVQLTTGNLILGEWFWNAGSAAWNVAANWDDDKTNSIARVSAPGTGSDVIFVADSLSGGAAITTTLEQNFKINSLTFEASTDPGDTPASVTIDPGADPANRLEVAPQVSTSGIAITAGGPGSVDINSRLKLGANQTWDVADSTATLTVSGSLLGEADVIKSGAGKVILSAAADPTFNTNQTADFTISGGTLEIQDVGALGALANSNLANIGIGSGGVFYLNNATATGTTTGVANPLTLNGGTLSSGGAQHYYTGGVNVTAASFINLRDSNGDTGVTTARNVVLSMGALTGSGSLTVDSVTTAGGGNQITGTLYMGWNDADNSAWTGNLHILRGTVSTNNENALGSGSTITAEKGRIQFGGTAGDRALAHDIVIASATEDALLELNQSSNVAITYTGQVTLGGAGGSGELRVLGGNNDATATFTGGVVLANDGLIGGRDASTRLLHIDSVISETGGARNLRINDGTWGGTGGTVRLTGANTFTGDVTVARGILEFDTVTNAGGAASSFGQGDAITLATTANSTLRFIGDGAANSQSTDRPIDITPDSTNRVGTLDARGTNGSAITYAGAITVSPDADGSWLVLTGLIGSEGFITGGFNQPGTSADVNVTGGAWTLFGTAVTVADDLLVQNPGTVLNLNTIGVLTWGGSTSNYLEIRNGATVNLGADETIADGIERLYVGHGGAGETAVLNTNIYTATTPRLYVGGTPDGREGNVIGAGTITVTRQVGSEGINLYRGSVAANLVGPAPLYKGGLGTVTLSGDNSGLTASGIVTTAATRLDAGTLILDYATDNNSKLATDARLDIRDAHLVLVGSNTAATSQSVPSTTFANNGAARITVNAGAGQDAVLNLGDLLRGASAGTVRFTLPDGAQSLTSGVTTTRANNATTGLLRSSTANSAAYATVDDGTGTWFATRESGSGARNIVAFISTPENDVTDWDNDTHVTDETTGFTGTLDSVRLHSLRFDSAGGNAVNVNPTGVLSVISGGILVTDQVTSGAPGILGGALVGGGASDATGPNELVFFQDSAQTFLVSSDITRNTAITKVGVGALRLSGNNTQTGIVRLQEGTLELAGGNAIGDNARVLLSAGGFSTLRLLADETVGTLEGGNASDGLREIGTVDADGFTLTLNENSASSRTFSGQLVGTGQLIKNGAYGQVFAGVSNDFTGAVIVNESNFSLSNVGELSASSFTVNGNGALLLTTTSGTRSSTRILATTPVILNSAAGSIVNTTVVRGFGTTTNQNNTTNETIGDLVLNSGANYFSGQATGSGNPRTTVSASDFVRNNSATVSIRATNLGGTTGAYNQFRTVAANEADFVANNLIGGGDLGNATQSILPWGIAESTGADALADDNMGNSLVTYVEDRGLVALDFGADYDDYASGGATSNVRQVVTADVTDLDGRTLNALVVHNDHTSASSTVNLTGSGAGHFIANTSGAFLFTLNPGAAADSAHSIVIDGFDDAILAPGGEYIFHVVNPSSAADTATLTVQIDSPLGSASDITKSGRGTLILTDANNIAGGGANNKTTLNEGILEIADLANIGGDTGELVFAGGALRFGAGLTDDISQRTIVFLPGGGAIDTNGVDLALVGSLGTGLGGFTKSGAGTLTLNAAAAYAGATTVVGGTLQLGTSNAIGSGALTVLGGGTLDLDGNDVSVSLVSTSGASPEILGAGAIASSGGFDFRHTGDTTIEANLAGDGGLFKNQNNVLTLTGANTYTGRTEIQAGTLVIDSIGDAGGGASALGNPINAQEGIIRMGLTTGATGLTYTGSGHSSDRLIGIQGTTGGVTLNANGAGAVSYGGVIGLTPNNNTLTLGGTSDAAIVNQTGAIDQGVINTLTVTKTGSNTWEVNQASNYSGNTNVDNGILQIGVDDALPIGTTVRIGTGSTAGTLDLNGFDQTVGALLSQTNSDTLTNNLIIDPGNTFTVDGPVTIGANAAASTTLFTATGGGAFVNNNDGGVFQIGGATGTTNTNAATADFSGLASFTVDLGETGTMRIGDNSGVTGGTAATSTLILADDNVVTADLLQVSGTQPQALQTLRLGSNTNQLNVNTLSVGSNHRGSGTVDFADTTGSVVLRAANGIGRAEVRMAAHTQGTNANNVNTVDFTGHNAALLISTLTMVDRTQSGTPGGPDNQGAGYATFSFDEGTMDVETLVLARRTGGGSGDGIATLNLGGGTVDIGATTMAVNTSAGGAVTGTINVTDGTVSFGTGSGTAINMANAGAGRTVTSDINLTGGAVTVTGDILRTGGAGTENATITLDGSTLDLSGNNIGDATNAIALVAASGTLQNLGELNGGGVLDKTSGGVLIVEGTNTYGGATTVSEGILLINGNNSGAAGAITVASGATLGGNGTLGGATAIDGTLSTGADANVGTVGSLAFNGQNLTFNDNSTWLVDIVQGGSPSSDAVTGVNDLNFNGTVNLALSFTDTFQLGNSYVIAGYSGAWNNGLFSVGGNPWADDTELDLGGGKYRIDYSGSGGVVLTAVPEPAALLPLAMLLLVGLLPRRRRRVAGGTGRVGR